MIQRHTTKDVTLTFVVCDRCQASRPVIGAVGRNESELELPYGWACRNVQSIFTGFFVTSHLCQVCDKIS